MPSFKDNNGRTWRVTVSVDAVKRVRDLVEIDLLEIVEGKLIKRLLSDPILLCDVIYAVCKPEADDAGVTDEDFGRAMHGDAIDQATQALLESVVSFCPSPRDRKNLGRVLETTNRVMDRARDVVEQKIQSGELDRMADQALTRAAAELDQIGTEESQHGAAGSSSASAPASSASTRPP